MHHHLLLFLLRFTYHLYDFSENAFYALESLTKFLTLPPDCLSLYLKHAFSLLYVWCARQIPRSARLRGANAAGIVFFVIRVFATLGFLS